MAIIDTKRRHSTYEDWTETADFLWRSYLGGRAYKDGDYLDKYPRELDLVHAARKERAYFLNFYAAVIDSYISSVYRRDPVREPAEEDAVSEEGIDAETVGTSEQEGLELTGPVGQFAEDATGAGDSLTEFMRSAATFALAAERAFVVVDVSPSGFPYVHLLHPANLLDYALADDGSYKWAIVAEEYIDDEDPYTERIEEQRFRLWLPSEWILFDSDGNEVQREKNSAGVVPIVEIAPGTGGVSLPTYDIAVITKRIYNLCSQLDEILINVTFPQLYWQGEGVEDGTGEPISADTQAIAIGISRALEIPEGATITPGFLAPPNGPVEAHIEERDRLIQTIYSLAGLQRRDPESLKAQSGVAKAYDFRETNERLVSLSQVIENAELRIFEMLSAYGLAANINVTYEKDFNVQDLRVAVDNHIKISAAALPVETKKRSALELSMLLAEEATERERREIQAAVTRMTAADFDVDNDPIKRILGSADNLADPETY